MSTARAVENCIRESVASPNMQRREHVLMTKFTAFNRLVGHCARQIQKAVGTLATVLLLVPCATQAQTISTIAGGAIGEGGAATSATLKSPQALVFDASDNLFVADVYNNRVRRIDAGTGIITTIAGNGTGGDGGLAANASLSLPRGLAMDTGGNLFIVDQGNQRIRKIAAGTGIITTVAGNGTAGFSGDGGLATGGMLNSPRFIALDTYGNLFVADTGNHRVRRIDAGTGIITTVAGNGTAGFSGDGGAAASASFYRPYGLAFDASGNLYVTDSFNNRIRKIAAGTGIVTTVAGDGSDYYNGDGGAATSASLYLPLGIAIDTDGNLLVTDTSNERVRKIAATTGIITTVAGNGSAGAGGAGDGGAATSAPLGNPNGLALDASGNLFVSEFNNSRIRKIAVATGIITTVAGGVTFAGDGGPATSAVFSSPLGMATDTSGNVYVADWSNHRVRKIAAGTGIITTIAGTGTPGFSGDGGLATAANLQNPEGLAVDASGNVYIADSYNLRIRKIAAGTGIITTAGGDGGTYYSGDDVAATASSLYYPTGVAVDASGNLFIADWGNNRIRRIDAGTGIITTVAGNGGAYFAGDGGAAIGASLNYPRNLTVDASGNVFISDVGNQRIRKVAAGTGIITTVAGDGAVGFNGDGIAATAASLNTPGGLAADAGGNLFFADVYNQRLRRIDALTGIISTVAGNGTAGFLGDGGPATSANLSSPYGVVFGASGSYYILDAGNDRIRLVAGGAAAVGLSVTHSGDFNGDGKADLLWKRADGSVVMWLMNGAAMSSSANLIGPASGWSVTQVADFNGDGKADLLWQHTDGSVGMWLMNGTTKSFAAGLIGPASGWSITQVADFNGDGKADLLWQHTDGSVGMWLMNGTTKSFAAGLIGAGSGWSVKQVADFNGDGKADLLWQHTDGSVGMWLMNGTTKSFAAGLRGAGSGWSVKQVADLNGDGKADLLWQHTDGSVEMWLMNGTTTSSSAGLIGAGHG